MAGTPILTTIEANMASIIEAMTTANGYNFSWQTCNIRDMAKAKWPTAIIELMPEETNLDEPDGVHAGAYLNECQFRIRVLGNKMLDEEYENPVFSANETLSKALDDLKQVFGVNYHLNTTSMIMYRRSVRIEKDVNNDIIIPSELETFWEVRYTQDRSTPTQTGC